MPNIIDLDDKKKRLEFVKSVKDGAVFAYPTEAVYGLGCDIKNKKSIKKILDIKKRDISKGLIVISDNLEKVRELIDDNFFKIFVESNSDTVPTTWLCPANPKVLPEITGSSKKVAIRITRHSVSCALCKILNMPIISTSANISGQKPILTPKEILDYFSNNIDYIVDGKIGESKKPTRILDLITKEVLREGG